MQVDKGVKRMRDSDSFICQKKNHFQVTLALQLAAEPAYVATQVGMLRISGLYVVMHGIKLEAPHVKIHLEQSLPDRTKRPFKPVPLELAGNDVYRITIGRLHFSEPTANNMRKRGRPNPQQNYFALVTTIAAKAGDAYYTVASLASERLVVRASNPRQFDAEPNLAKAVMWQRGQGNSSAYHVGNIGINTEAPDEALSVIGNIKVSGAIMQPCDRRLKTSLQPVSTESQLARLRQMQLYNYEYLLDSRNSRAGAKRTCTVRSGKAKRGREERRAMCPACARHPAPSVPPQNEKLTPPTRFRTLAENGRDCPGGATYCARGRAAWRQPHPSQRRGDCQRAHGRSRHAANDDLGRRPAAGQQSGMWTCSAAVDIVAAL